MNETIAIDLGTSYSLVATYQDSEPNIVPYQNNDVLTPSIVSFVRGQSYIGQRAAQSGEMYPENCIKVAKRLIGRLFSDPYVQTTVKTQKYAIVKDSQENAIVQVNNGGLQQTYKPEQIGAKIIEALVQQAQQNCSRKITRAVITVPTYFNNLQRYATKQAGTIAGLQDVKLINEPTAAALCYARHFYQTQILSSFRNILIFDFGGGTFDVSVVKVFKNEAEVISTGGDADLGGEDLTQLIVDYIIKDLRQEYNHQVNDNKLYFRIRNICEMAKRDLSTNTSAEIELLNALPNGEDYETNISRSFFESLCKQKFNRCINIVKQTVKDAKFSLSSIDDIVPVGGSSRIPKLMQMLQDLFNRPIHNNHVDLDQAVVFGAAIKAAMVDNKIQGSVKEVTSLSLGINQLGDLMSVVLERNTRFPVVKRSGTFYSTVMDQTSVKGTILEGERPLVQGNMYLGDTELSNLPKRPQGELQIYYEFDINDSGLLKVTIHNELSGKSKSTTIEQFAQQRTAQDVQNHLELAERMKVQDQADKQKMILWKTLHQQAHQIQNRLKYKDLINVGPLKRNQLQELSEEAISWVNRNKNSSQIQIQSEMVSFRLKLQALGVYLRELD